jgi:hypothetical protein
MRPWIARAKPGDDGWSDGKANASKLPPSCPGEVRGTQMFFNDADARGAKGATKRQ